MLAMRFRWKNRQESFIINLSILTKSVIGSGGKNTLKLIKGKFELTKVKSLFLKDYIDLLISLISKFLLDHYHCRNGDTLLIIVIYN
jgi:hypothetical protein